MKICTNCKRKTDDFSVKKRSTGLLEAVCRACRRAKAKQYNSAARAAVLRHYGGSIPSCACCGEQHEEFLTLDHTAGNGGLHRKEVASAKVLASLLKKQGYPPGYRVLCMNCNFSMGTRGYCPHAPLA